MLGRLFGGRHGIRIIAFFVSCYWIEKGMEEEGKEKDGFGWIAEVVSNVAQQLHYLQI